MINVLLFDLETTGFPRKNANNKYKPYTDLTAYNTSRIVEIGLIVVEVDEKDNPTVKREYNFIIKPNNFVINNSQCHGISQERAINEGVDFSYAIDQIKHEFKYAGLLVAHNILFDKNVLLSELYRASGQDHFIDLIFEIPTFCTCEETRRLVGLKKRIRGKTIYKRANLSGLFEFLFKRKHSEVAHSALGDTRVLTQCFNELLRRKFLILK